MANLELPRYIAHRGASAYAPENTLASFVRAKELGAQWVEFDVMMTACGELVVFHDDTLDRTTDGHGKLSEHTYEQLKKLDAGRWFGEFYVGEKIPTLKETFQCLEEQGLGANIEIKPWLGSEKKTAEKTLDLIKKHWPNTLPPPLLSSFSMESVQAIEAQKSEYPLGLLLQTSNLNWEKSAEQFNYSTVHLPLTAVNPALVQSIKKTGRIVLVYTVNEPDTARTLFEWGVDGVFTDDILGIKLSPI